jgi:hypothetical protein
VHVDGGDHNPVLPNVTDGKLHVLPNANNGPGRHAASRGDIQLLYLQVGTRNALVPAHSTSTWYY